MNFKTYTEISLDDLNVHEYIVAAEKYMGTDLKLSEPESGRIIIEIAKMIQTECHFMMFKQIEIGVEND